jgi:hypothetical protein
MRGVIREQGVSQRLRADIVTVCRMALAGVILLLIALSYYPFAWDPPRMVSNDVTRSANGSLQFGMTNYARSPGRPAWLPSVRASGIIQIQLTFNPQSPQPNSPASIMMLASDYWHTDFAIEQDHSDLVVWLRRPGSDVNGNPAYVLRGVLRPRAWNSVRVVLQSDGLRISVDGRTRLAEHLPANAARSWSPGQIALGNEVHGGKPWLGRIRLAEVRTPGYAVNYVRPGALSIPESYLYLPDHIEPFPPQNRGQWLLAFLDLLSFIPVGFLIAWARRPPLSPVSATLLSAALALLLGAGKFLFHARHTSVANLLMQVAGAWLGAWLASRLARTRTRRHLAQPRVTSPPDQVIPDDR